MENKDGADARLLRSVTISVLVLRKTELTAHRTMACDAGLDVFHRRPIWPRKVDVSPVTLALDTNPYGQQKSWYSARPRSINQCQAGILYNDNIAERALLSKQAALKEHKVAKKQRADHGLGSPEHVHRNHLLEVLGFDKPPI